MATPAVRPCQPGDLPAVQAIYAHYVEKTVISFEEAAPSLEEMQRRFSDVVDHDLPFLVATLKGEVVGYAYVSPWHSRPAYRHTGEHSVYVQDKTRGGGIGKALLLDLMKAAREAGIKQLVAVVGDSENLPSIAFHERHGFVRVGTLKRVGYKFERWLDVVLLQRAL